MVRANKPRWESIDPAGRYWVSSDGNVKAVWPHKENILKPAVTWDGYRKCTVIVGNKKKSMKVARLVAVAFIPNPENLPMVLHKNGNHTDDCVENLYWGSHEDNTRDRKKHNGKGIIPLTRQQVDEIIMLGETEPPEDIATRYNIKLSRVNRILRGVTHRKSRITLVDFEPDSLWGRIRKAYELTKKDNLNCFRQWMYKGEIPPANHKWLVMNARNIGIPLSYEELNEHLSK